MTRLTSNEEEADFSQVSTITYGKLNSIEEHLLSLDLPFSSVSSSRREENDLEILKAYEVSKCMSFKLLLPKPRPKIPILSELFSEVEGGECFSSLIPNSKNLSDKEVIKSEVDDRLSSEETELSPGVDDRLSSDFYNCSWVNLDSTIKKTRMRAMKRPRTDNEYNLNSCNKIPKMSSDDGGVSVGREMRKEIDSWLEANVHNPHPSEALREIWGDKFGKSKLQINGHCSNWRTRYWDKAAEAKNITLTALDKRALAASARKQWVSSSTRRISTDFNDV